MWMYPTRPLVAQPLEIDVDVFLFLLFFLFGLFVFLFFRLAFVGGLFAFL